MLVDQVGSQSFQSRLAKTFTGLAVFVFVQMEQSGVEISQVGRQVQTPVSSSQVQAKAHCASAEECPHSLPFFVPIALQSTIIPAQYQNTYASQLKPPTSSRVTT